MPAKRKKLTHDPLMDEIAEVSDDISDVSPLDIPVMAVFSCLFLIVALQFFSRYILNDSPGWTEEIARYFLIMLGFVGGITCVRKNRHIFLEFAYHYLPVKAIKPVVVVAETLVLAFWGYAGWLGVELAQKTRSNMVSVAVPKAYLYYIVAAGCFLMAAYALMILVRRFGSPAEDIAREKLDPAERS